MPYSLKAVLIKYLASEKYVTTAASFWVHSLISFRLQIKLFFINLIFLRFFSLSSFADFAPCRSFVYLEPTIIF